MSGLYVYALTATKVPPFREAGIDLHSIDLGGVFAVAERLGQAPAVSEETLRRQQALIVSIAARVEAVLPARFGSLVELEELRRLVDARRDLILDALNLVRGREQMTVRIAGGDLEPAAAPASALTGTDYLNQRRAESSGRSLPGVDAVQFAVRDLVSAQRVQPGKPFVIVYHLVAAGANRRYRARIAEAAPGMSPLQLRVSGPWPAFAFVPELIG